MRYRDFLEIMNCKPGDEPNSPHNKPGGLLMAHCTWFDGIAFCNRLSEREGSPPPTRWRNKPSP